MLVTDPTNVRYVAERTSSHGGACLIGPDYSAVVFDRRGALPETPRRGFDEREPADFESILVALGDFEGGLGYEDHHLTVADLQKLDTVLGDRVRLVPAGGVIDAVREIKSPDEIGHIKDAADIADKVLTFLIGISWKGQTEQDIAITIEQKMIALGAEGPAFGSIVAKAPTNAMPHATGGSGRIEDGDLVLVDIGARCSGYVSDITRMFSVGPVADEVAMNYRLLLDAQTRGLNAVRAGAGSGTVDAAARTVLENAGLGEYFGHGLGHGVGITIHEDPRLSPFVSDRTLETGNVVTVEPGLYFPGRYGLRIEDLVVVGADGPIGLSSFPKAEPTVVS